MMHLHNDRELFREVIISASEELGIVVPIVEKDYYVTMILKCLSEARPECVFKGGTSLSKCHHVINRFSEDIDIADRYALSPFVMNVQGIERTLIDKVFAICDYYMQGKVNRYSRHIYDIYMLLPKVKLDQHFNELVRQVRSLRAKMDMCPSAVKGVNISRLLNEIIEKEIYKADYIEITTYFQNYPIEYEKAIGALKEIVESGMFEEGE